MESNPPGAAVEEPLRLAPEIGKSRIGQVLYARPVVSSSTTKYIPIAMRGPEPDIEGLLREIKKYGDTH